MKCQRLISYTFFTIRYSGNICGSSKSKACETDDKKSNPYLWCCISPASQNSVHCPNLTEESMRTRTIQSSLNIYHLKFISAISVEKNSSPGPLRTTTGWTSCKKDDIA